MQQTRPRKGSTQTIKIGRNWFEKCRYGGKSSGNGICGGWTDCRKYPAGALCHGWDQLAEREGAANHREASRSQLIVLRDDGAEIRKAKNQIQSDQQADRTKKHYCNEAGVSDRRGQPRPRRCCSLGVQLS